jgi:hypothetical protein
MQVKQEVVTISRTQIQPEGPEIRLGERLHGRTANLGADLVMNQIAERRPFTSPEN